MKIHRTESILINDNRGNLIGSVYNDVNTLMDFLVQEVPSSIYNDIKNKLKGKIGVLKNISVNEKGKGYGNSLVSDFLEECSIKNVDYAVLIADLGGDQAPGFDLVNWYESFGFEKIGESYAGPFMILEI